MFVNNQYLITPLDLFELIDVYLLGCPWLSTILLPFKLSNLTFTIFLLIILVCYLFSILKILNTLIFNALTIVLSVFFNTLKTIVRETLIINKNIHFVLFFILFFTILLYNLSGILPYSLSITSHFSITFTLSFIFFIGFNIIGVSTQKSEFISLFLPKGTPYVIIPFIVAIELVSYTTRVFSLAIRLFANIISGHTLLKILGTFTWTIIVNGTIWIFLSVFPFILICIIMGLECAIAILQAYVFTILLLVYLKDNVYGH